MKFVRENPRTALGVVYLCSQIAGVSAWVLCLIWATSYHGGLYGVTSDILYNLHVFLMPFFEIFLNGSGIVLFRLLNTWETATVKKLHALIHGLAFLGMIAGVASVIVAKEMGESTEKHFWSFHSWIGITNFAVYTLLFLISSLVYLNSGFTQEARKNFSGLHAFIGVINFLLSTTVACLGISDRTLLLISNLQDIPGQSIIANLAGFCLIAYAAAILYIVVNPYFEWESIGKL